MITWMQRHKKYLIITIWISTIAFVGAGFVGWGQYSYGDKASAVAKVGDIEISRAELQKSYSNLYNQYNKAFQGNFDEAKAKSFGLQSQALRQLTNQALILNLATSYDLEVSDAELLAEIKAQEYFYKNGSFNKEIYKESLSRNNLSIKDYEEDVRKELLIQKTLKLLPMKTNDNEAKILDTIMKIADKINYKVLSEDEISIDSSDELLKQFWQTKKQNFMNDMSYEVNYIKQTTILSSFDEKKISEYYSDNKTHFKSTEGKILALDEAKNRVIEELSAKRNKKVALKTYITYKKGKLSPEFKESTATISASNNSFNFEILQLITKLTPTAPFMKPVLFNDEYYIFKLTKVNPSTAKTFQEAKRDVLPMYVKYTKKAQLLKLAQDSLNTFHGTTTNFLSNTSDNKFKNLTASQTNEFLMALFTKTEKRGFIPLSGGKIVLYSILEQKLLNKSNNNQNASIIKLKSAMFNEGLIKNLQNKYKTEIFIQGL